MWTTEVIRVHVWTRGPGPPAEKPGGALFGVQSVLQLRSIGSAHSTTLYTSLSPVLGISNYSPCCVLYPAKADSCSVAGWQALVDDWEFQEEPFLEFVGPSLQTLAEQLQSCEDYDAQLKVCSTWPACDGSHVWQPAHNSRMLCRTGAEYRLCISRQGAGKSVHVHTSGAVRLGASAFCWPQRLFAMHPSCKLYHSSNASMATIGAHQAASRHHACPLTASFETVP